MLAECRLQITHSPTYFGPDNVPPWPNLSSQPALAAALKKRTPTPARPSIEGQYRGKAAHQPAACLELAHISPPPPGQTRSSSAIRRSTLRPPSSHFRGTLSCRGPLRRQWRRPRSAFKEWMLSRGNLALLPTAAWAFPVDSGPDGPAAVHEQGDSSRRSREVRGSRARDRSGGPGRCGFQCDVERLEADLSEDWTRGSARHPRTSESNRASAGRVLSAIFQDQRYSPGETSAALLDRLALAVGLRNLRAVADEPVVVPLDDSRELVSHCQSLLLGASAAIAVPLNGSERMFSGFPGPCILLPEEVLQEI